MPLKKDCIPDFDKDTVDKMIELAEKLTPLPYLYWHLYLDEQDWINWKDKLCRWMPGRPPLGRVIKKHWAIGIKNGIEEIGRQEKGWQAWGWRLERFDPERFGRYTRFQQPADRGKKPKAKPTAEKGEKAIGKLDPDVLMRIAEKFDTRE